MTELNLPPSPTEDGTAPLNLIRLRDLVAKHFSREEVKDICMELHYDYENVPDAKNMLIRELILQMEREERLPSLISIIRRLRPKAPLEKIYAHASEPVKVAKRGNWLVSLLRDADREFAQAAGKSLQTIALLADNQENIRELMVQYRTQFETTSSQINLITTYKLLHDLFQDLETNYFLIYNDQKKLPKDESVWDSIELLYELELRHKIEELLAVVQQQPELAEEGRWAQRLDEAQTALQTAVSTFDTAQLKRGTRLLNRTISRELSRINISLVNTVGLLQLDTLQQAMATISQHVPQAESQMLDEGATALKAIQGRIKLLVSEHNAWQEMDDELRLIDDGFTHDFDDLKQAWPDFVLLTKRICTDRNDTWAKQLLLIVDDLTHAINQALITAVKRHFRRFRSTTSRRFRQADRELLALCTELTQVGQPLPRLFGKAT